MATQKLQAGRALQVIPSDYCDIPFPNKIITSTVTGGDGLFIFEDSTVDFIALGVEIGDIIYTSSSTACTVEKVIDANTIQVNASGYVTITNEYTIYKGGLNQGCVLYVGVGTGPTDILTVNTIGDDKVEFLNVTNAASSGQFFPVQVTKVWSVTTDYTNIVALW